MYNILASICVSLVTFISAVFMTSKVTSEIPSSSLASLVSVAFIIFTPVVAFYISRKIFPQRTIGVALYSGPDNLTIWDTEQGRCILRNDTTDLSLSAVRMPFLERRPCFQIRKG